MAITPIGSLGTANIKVAAADLTFSPSRNVAAGRFVAIWVAWDSIFNIFLPTHGENFFSCYDSVGNWYSNVGAVTDRQGPNATGAFTGLWVAQLSVPLTTGDTIIVTDGGVGASFAKAMSVEEFDLGAGMRWAQNQDGWGGATQEVHNTQPSSVGVNLHFTQTWLVLHALGNEGPSTDSFTWDGAWTQITTSGTTGGSADSNITILGGYKIATTNSESINVTNNTASRDVTQVMIGICATPETTFPTTPILDDFNRADEDPLSGGGNWLTTSTAFGSDWMAVSANQAVGGGGSFWDDVWEGCAEVYCTIADYGGEPQMHLFARGSAATATMQGVGLSWPTSSGLLYFTKSGLQGGASGTNIVVSAIAADGVKIGIKRTKSTTAAIHGENRLWVDRGGSWEEIAAYFFSGAPPEYLVGRAALACATSVPRFDDFGGGQVDCFARGRQQIYRILRGTS